MSTSNQTGRMDEQTECSACGGSGAGCLDAARFAVTAKENSGRGRRMGVALRLEARRNPCSVCHGSGRVTAARMDEQARRDAMADAEQLWLLARINRRHPTFFYLQGASGYAQYSLETKMSCMVASSARLAAKVAFRAVPGLRG